MRSIHDEVDSPAGLNLTSAWGRGAASGQLRSEFNAPHDDPEERWQAGDRILFGVARSGQGLRYAAKNLSTGKVIDAAFEEREIPGTWFRCRLNAYRALRPGGRVLGVGQQREISPSPLECRFYCRDAANPLSLLRRAPLALVRLKHHLWGAYYNAAPLEVEGHFIWLPIRARGARTTLPHYLQALNRAVIEDIFLLRERGRDFLLFFNSLRAGASVNHLHVHGLYRSHTLAIERQQAAARGGLHVLDGYPAGGFVFQGAGSAGLVNECAMRLQEGGVPFNLIWAGERVFLVPRDAGHEVTEEFPSDPLSAMDVCGRIYTTDRATYDAANKERIEAALRKSTTDAGKLLRSWEELPPFPTE